MKYLPLLVLVTLSLSAGCGCGKKGDFSPASREQAKGTSRPPAQVDQKPVEGKEEPRADLPRKIKFTAEMKLIVEDFGKSEGQLKQVIKDHKSSYIAQSEISGSPGSIRTGHWRVRVPVNLFEPFREAILKIGEVEKNTTDSEDVTEEYYDLESHVKNKLAEEEGLRKLLEKTADKMENFLAVRRELSQVRDDILRKQGRLKMLANLTDMTTVNIYLREKQKYESEKAPQVAETPTFGRRIGRTFEDSLGMLIDFGQALVLFVVGIGPWLVPLGLIGLPSWWIFRRRLKQPVRGGTGSNAQSS